MKLSAETFQSIVSFIGSARPDEDSDRRRRPRVEVTGYATIQIRRPDQADEEAKVVVRDVSPEGIGIMHTAPLRMGDQFVLKLPSDSGRPKGILCTVTRWRADSEKLFSIGAVFTQDVSAATTAPQAA
jgi:hypothetical protein